MAAPASLAIDRPDTAAIGELVRAYYTMMRMFGWDLGGTAHARLSPTLGPRWFSELIEDRKAMDPRHYPAKQTFELQDPVVALRDFAYEGDSPFREAFGFSHAKELAAKKIIWERNRWFHFSDERTIDDLLEVAASVRIFAQDAGLATASHVVTLINRLQRIKSGRHQPSSAQQPPAPAPAPEPEKPAEVEIPEQLPRPRIGGIWTGEIPDARYRITRTGDIVEASTFESLRQRLGADFEARARQWLAVRPRGDELWVAEDGAIGGWINEHPRLLGYLGQEPDDDQPRGFLLPHLYETRTGAIADLDSGATVESEIVAGLEPGTLLRVTTYGDVVAVDEASGTMRVATVTASEWFPGQLD